MVRTLLLPVLYAFSSVCFAACETTLSAADNMMFDKRKISVDSSCEKFVINFVHKGKMPIAAGGHNVVIIKTKDFNAVVKKIDMKLGAETGFLPEIPEVLAKTAIIGGGRTSLSIDISKLDKGVASIYLLFSGPLRGNEGYFGSFLERKSKEKTLLLLVKLVRENAGLTFN